MRNKTSDSIQVTAVQLGPIHDSTPREETLERLIWLLEKSAAEGGDLVVFPEAALTAFFVHWLIEDEEHLLSYFEDQVPGPNTEALYAAARKAGVAFVLGFAERTPENRFFNTAVFVDEQGVEVHRYRKIHLPGFMKPDETMPFQNLEKRYFEVGDLGFGVAPWRHTKIGLAICNDRRWPETYRELALQGAEIACIGYNTPRHSPPLPESDPFAEFHHLLSIQAGAYQNAMWVIAAGKAGLEEGVDQIGATAIVSPNGDIVAKAETVDDELVTAEVDFSVARRYRQDIFNFGHHRRPEHYQHIVEPIDEASRQQRRD